MKTTGLSVITVCMNRQHHLQATAFRVAESVHHQEHLVLDWSSREPLRRDQLPNDSRIRLERVEGESTWNLCRAYNVAAKLAHGDVLLKLDADCWPEHIDPALHLKTVSDVCWFGSGSDGRLGQFLMSRAAFEAVGGFNELLVGYGFDDKDLKARLKSFGFVIQLLPEASIGVIPHSIHERVSRTDIKGLSSSPLQESLSFAQRRATAMSNRVAAAYSPWTTHSMGTRYVQSQNQTLIADQTSVPQHEPPVAGELERLRRQVFWGEFLLIPAAVVRRLPQCLLSSDAKGFYVICQWHKIYWLSIRQIFHFLVMPLEPGFWRI